MIGEISTIYWTYDLLQDVRVLAKTHGCYPILVTETITKIADMKPSSKQKGVPLQEKEFTSKYGLPSSIIPSDSYILSKSKKTKLIPADVARYFLRKEFPKTQDWIFHRLTLWMGIQFTPLTKAIVKHWSSVIKEEDIDELPHATNYIKLKKLNALQNPNLESTVWIFENYIQSSVVDIEDVKFHTSSNHEKHQTLKKASGCADLPAFELYEHTMLHRAGFVNRLCVKSDSLAWKFIETGDEREKLTAIAVAQFYSDLAKIGIDEEVIESIKETERENIQDLEHGQGILCILRSIPTIRCLARHNAKISYVDKDGVIEIEDIEINGVTYNAIPRSWIRRSCYIDDEWDFYLFNISPNIALDICSMITRFAQLNDALKQHFVKIQDEPKSCEMYVINGDGGLDYILNNIRECSFFKKYTDHDYYTDVLNKTGFVSKNYNENSETAKLASLVSYEGDTALIPLRFQDVTASQRQEAYDKVLNAIIKLEDMDEQERNHTCYICGCWKDLSDDEYCSGCASSDEDL
jgi:hypothetical protein